MRSEFSLNASDWNLIEDTTRSLVGFMRDLGFQPDYFQVLRNKTLEFLGQGCHVGDKLAQNELFNKFGLMGLFQLARNHSNAVPEIDDLRVKFNMPEQRQFYRGQILRLSYPDDSDQILNGNFLLKPFQSLDEKEIFTELDIKDITPYQEHVGFYMLERELDDSMVPLSEKFEWGGISEEKLNYIGRIYGKALGDVHKRGITYNDFFLSHLYVNKEGMDDSFQIIDFGVSSLHDPIELDLRQVFIDHFVYLGGPGIWYKVGADTPSKPLTREELDKLTIIQDSFKKTYPFPEKVDSFFDLGDFGEQVVENQKQKWGIPHYPYKPYRPDYL